MATNSTPLPWSIQPVANQAAPQILSLEDEAYRELDRMNASWLEHFITGPDNYHARRVGAIQDTDSPAMRIGRALHCYVLEGDEAFADRYMICDGPVNPKTGKAFGRETKAFAEWEAEQRLDGVAEFLTQAEGSLIYGMADAISENEHAHNLLLSALPEQSIVAEFDGVPVKGRLDAVDYAHRTLVDVKTVAEAEKVDFSFPRYARQLAFYRRLLQCVTNGEVFNAFLIVVDKTPLARVRVLQATASTLCEADRQITEALARYKQCLADGRWESPYAGFVGTF